MSTSKIKVVVFDLDETLGYFFELGIFWELLINYFSKNKINKIELSQDSFNELLNLFPEFLRPNIFSILNYLKYKKTKNECSHVMIYTNNQGPKQWVNTFMKK